MSFRNALIGGMLSMMMMVPGQAAAQNPVVVMETSMGNITIELLQEQAPVTVENFLQYVDDGFYSGTVFHRVIEGFMIQGGGLTANLSEKQTRAPITNEADNGVSNERGTIAMARTNVVDSATAQFFINTVDNAPQPRPPGPAEFRLRRLRPRNRRHGRRGRHRRRQHGTAGSPPERPGRDDHHHGRLATVGGSE